MRRDLKSNRRTKIAERFLFAGTTLKQGTVGVLAAAGLEVIVAVVGTKTSAILQTFKVLSKHKRRLDDPYQFLTADILASEASDFVTGADITVDGWLLWGA